MKWIKIKDHKVRIDTFDWQISPLGEKFKNVGLSMNCKIPPKYDEKQKMYVHHWIYHFRYDSGRYFSIEVDYNGKFVQLKKD